MEAFFLKKEPRNFLFLYEKADISQPESLKFPAPNFKIFSMEPSSVWKASDLPPKSGFF